MSCDAGRECTSLDRKQSNHEISLRQPMHRDDMVTNKSSHRSIFRLLLRYASRYRRQTSRWMRSQLQTSEPPRPRTRGVSTCPSRRPMHSGGSLEASTHSAAGPPNEHTPTIEETDRTRSNLAANHGHQTRLISVQAFKFLYVQRPYLSLTLPLSLVWIRPLL